MKTQENRDDVPFARELGVATQQTKVAVVTLYGIPYAEQTYNTVLFRITDPAHEPYEIRLTPADAQRLGHALNIAGGGTHGD